MTRLCVIGLFDGDTELQRVDISFEGEVFPEDADGVFLANYFRDIFSVHGWTMFRQQFDEVLRGGGLQRAEQDGFQPTYMEVTIKVKAGERTLTLPSGRELAFNRIVWGLLTKFQRNDADRFRPSENAMKRATEFFGLTFKTVVGTTPVGKP